MPEGKGAAELLGEGKGPVWVKVGRALLGGGTTTGAEEDGTGTMVPVPVLCWAAADEVPGMRTVVEETTGTTVLLSTGVVPAVGVVG